MWRTTEEWTDFARSLGAFWQYGGNLQAPHALLTAKEDGRDHSDGFFNWGLIAQYPGEQRKAAYDLSRLLMGSAYKELLFTVDRIVGAGYGAITLASDLAYEFNPSTGHKRVKSGFTEKLADGSMKARLVQPGEVVLVLEDTITSGTGVMKTIRAVIAAGGLPLHVVAAICNRSGQTHISHPDLALDMPIVSLITPDMHTWTAGECPLCKAGSEAIRPKQGNNWQLLNQPYPLEE